jgi:hypothetical protein
MNMGNDVIQSGETKNFINAENGVQVAHADSFAPVINIYMQGNAASVTDFSSNYYNLLIGFNPLEEKHVSVDRKRALTEYMAPEVSEKFCGWSDETIDKIKRLPAIIIEERDKNAIDNQQGVIATLKKIQLRQFDIVITFQIIAPITMRFIQDNMMDLGLEHEWELNRTHWAIKNINLMEVLADAEISIENK